ncbi:conserved hypothetical protein [Beutenbergia cavernae DSM 12333]|uniref:ESX-1 secretion-associated protein n=1 Tax=Beutenbergia cavernae (strain ATCC BAA-8 / DSM 12333 / CCUG 43141 / JCM 11478 / NBRC 16432 / NCIMB 13614 / HKI 0122) TaxID=471853 RepID=C5BZG5_BEUC1|nr:type VII secretion target [Beutenbergia cavernae]ACQ79137.1 conserved hypothetical protein [Beutenbergia cavernae DSM 12333]
MSESFHIDDDVLRAHARKVDMVADDVAEAGSAATSVDLDGGAFGLLCAFLPPIVSESEASTGDAVGAAARLLADTATRVTEMARDYAAMDDDLSGRLARMEPS